MGKCILFFNSNHNIIFELALINCIKVIHLSNLYELIILALDLNEIRRLVILPIYDGHAFYIICQSIIHLQNKESIKNII